MEKYPACKELNSTVLSRILKTLKLGLDARKPVYNTGADQPAHPRSLISAFVIR